MASAAEQLLIRLTGATDSASLYVAAAVTVTACVLGFCFSEMRKRKLDAKKPWAFLPGALPIIGHLHLIFPIKEIVDRWEDWADKYAPKDVGCYEMELIGRRFIMITSEERAM